MREGSSELRHGSKVLGIPTEGGGYRQGRKVKVRKKEDVASSPDKVLIRRLLGGV